MQQKKKLSRKVISYVLALVMVFSTFTGIVPGTGITVQAEGTDKTIAGLGTSAIGNPTSTESTATAWAGSYVYYGKYNNTPTKYRVLDRASSDFGVAGGSLLLDCNTTLYNAIFYDNYNSNAWSGSPLRSGLQGEAFLNKSGVFTEQEKGAIALSKKAGVATGDGSGHSRLNYAALSGDTVFVLDAKEASRVSYGYASNGTRKKSGTSVYCWWLRSPHVSDTAYVGDVLCSFGGSNYGSIDYGTSNRKKSGVSPAFNIKLSSVIFASAISGEFGSYKLTLKDDKLDIALTTDKKVTQSGNALEIPYTVSGDNSANATQVSVLVTDKAYTDSDAKILKYGKLADVSTSALSGEAVFELPSDLTGTLGTDYHVYLLAEDVNGEKETDYANLKEITEDKIEIKPAQTVNPPEKATGLKYTGQKQALLKSGATVTTGNTTGTISYKLTPTDDESWKTDISEIKATSAGEYKVYYKVEGNDEYGVFISTDEQAVSVSIAKADSNPETPTGLKGVVNQKLSTVPLPEGWSWDVGDTVMSSEVGTYQYKASYTPTDANYNGKTAVDLDVELETLRKYGLWLGGTEVSNANYAGEGWSYDEEKQTLTLNNYSYTGNGGGKPSAIYLDSEYDLKINLIGDNNITISGNTGGNKYGIYTENYKAGFTIEGEGNLNINFDDTNGSPTKLNAIHLEPGKSFTMNGTGTVHAKGGKGQESYGIYCDGSITFNSGTFIGEGNLTTRYESRGIGCSNITVNGADTVVKGIAPLDNSDEARGFQNSTVIINDGTVIAQGKPTFEVLSSYSIRAGAGGTLKVQGGDSEDDLTDYDSLDAAGVSSCKCLKLTVNKKEQQSIKAPTAATGLKYTSQPQVLLTSGASVEDEKGNTAEGSIKYKVGTEGTWSPDIPSATNAGTYEVYYKVEGNEVYAEYAPDESFAVTIAKAASTVTKDSLSPEQKPTAKTEDELVYTGESIELVTDPATPLEGYKVQYSKDDGTTWIATIPEEKNVGDYTVKAKYVSDNYEDIPLDDIAVTITPVSKEQLEKAVKDASDYLETIEKKGKDNDDYSKVISDLQDAINAANETLKKDDLTPNQLGQAVKAVNDAKDAAEKAVKDIDDEKAARAVLEKINALKPAADITLNDRADIEAARKAYNDLKDDQKAKLAELDLNAVSTLEAAEKALTTAEKEVFDAEKATQKKAAEELAVEGDSKASQKLIADAIAAIDGLEFDEKLSLEENKAAIEEIVSKLKNSLNEQRAAEKLAADKEAFEAEKEVQKKAADALAVDGDSDASKKLIEDAKKAIDALKYDESKSLEENKAALAAIVSKLKDDLTAKRAAEKKEADDTAAANKVIEAINKLPASDKIATTDKAAIEAARKAYDALTADQKKKVPADVLKKLTDAETALKAAEKDAANAAAAKKVVDAINKLPVASKVTVPNKAAIEATRKAYNSLTADQKKLVDAATLKKLTDDEKALAALAAADKSAKELEAAKKEAQAAMNEGITVTQKGKKFTVKWKKSSSADGYYVYAQYCGKKITKPVKTIKKNTTTKVTLSKIGGKKINQKKNFRVYVAPYKIVDGKKVTLGKSMTAHLVGAKNAKYSNVKKLTVKKKKYTVKVGKTAKIKAKVTLVNKNKKHIPKSHGAKFRYKSSDTGIATVDKNGKIKGIKKGTCTIYVYSINGLTKKAKVTVK